MRRGKKFGGLPQRGGSERREPPARNKIGGCQGGSYLGVFSSDRYWDADEASNVLVYMFRSNLCSSSMLVSIGSPRQARNRLTMASRCLNSALMTGAPLLTMGALSR